MLLAVYKYVKNVVNNRATNEIENEDGITDTNAIQTSMAGGELQISTIHAINNNEFDSKFQEFDSKFQEFERKLDNLSVQIQNIQKIQKITRLI